MPWTQTSTSGALQRPLGNSEYAFVPSASQLGLGDMFLHLSFRAPSSRMNPDRVALAWAILRIRNPLLMARVIKDPEYLFSIQPLRTAKAVIDSANDSLKFINNKSREELMLGYMNGSRALTDDQLSCVTICSSEGDHYDLMMCAPHFIGDGTSLHQTTHELVEILSSQSTEEDLLRVIEKECEEDWLAKLPPPVEDRLPALNRWTSAVAKVNFEQTLYKEIGGQTFARISGPESKTVLLERSYTPARTSDILKRCKSKGVTVNHAVFGICNVAWARVRQKQQQKDRPTLPLMMYSAINLRSYLTPHQSTTPWFIALTYFNVVMPSFLPASKEVFWSRCANIKSQIRRTTQSPFLLERANEMAKRRAARAGRPSQEGKVTLQVGKKDGCREDAILEPAPSAALLGLSLIGNLDAVYKGPYSDDFVLHDVTTASRLKPGGMLLLSHTFRGQLWFQLFFDINGFEKGGNGKAEVEELWEEIGTAIDEFLV